ncbi:MAG TPA: TIGR03086 family metal-binding protein [Dehalococcoidia bacterium]|nr:TIGR03086 family metal-binding protein [Dehalococcoidia bacterium]
MTTNAMPNPIEVYETSVKQAQKVIRGVKPNQLSQPTPCSYWTVQGLMAHMATGPSQLSAFLESGTPPTPGTLSKESSLQAFDAATAKALTAAKAPGALAKQCKTPVGEMTGGQFMMMVAGDLCVHAWDLAKATGQDTKLDPKLAEVSHAVFSPMAQFARQAGAFGPEVKVPANASAQDKLLAMTGRKP